jgi:hypothetical protein
MMRRLDLTDNERAVLITTLRRLVDFHQVVSFKSPADTPAMPGMLRKSTAFVPRYQKFESISLQRRVGELLVPERRSPKTASGRYRAGQALRWKKVPKIKQ